LNPVSFDSLGYHLASVIIQLISYSIVLIAIAAVIAAVMGKFKTHTLLIFGWLFLAGALLDLGVVAFRKFVVAPHVRRILEQMGGGDESRLLTAG